MAEQGPFSRNDKPVIRNCLNSFLDSWIVHRMELPKDCLLLHLMYSAETPYKYKALGVVETEDRNLLPQFIPAYPDVRFTWKMAKPDGSPLSEFLLVHAMSNHFVKVADDGFHIEVTNNCSFKDQMAKWTLFWPDGKVGSDFDEDYSNTYYVMVAMVVTAIGAYLIIWVIKRCLFIWSGLKYEKKIRMPVKKPSKKKDMGMTSKFRKKTKM